MFICLQRKVKKKTTDRVLDVDAMKNAGEARHAMRLKSFPARPFASKGPAGKPEGRVV